MPKQQPPARSLYNGLRLTVMQQSPDKPCIVHLAVKQHASRWDDWDLLFPAIRVPVPPGGIDGYTGVLEVIVTTVQALLRADQEYQ